MFWKSIVFISLSLGAVSCAAQKQSPAQEQKMQAQVVLLENRTANTVYYRYLDYFSEQNRDHRNMQNYSISLGTTFNEEKLEPGSSVRLNVTPGTTLSLRFSTTEKEIKQELEVTQHQTISILTSGLKTHMGMPGFERPDAP